MAYDKFTKVSKYLLVNSIFSTSLYYGFVEHVEGAERVAMAIAWFCIIFSWFFLSDKSIEIIRENPSLIPAWVDRTFDISVTAVFFWFGSVWTASFYFIHILLAIAAKEKAKEAVDEH